jgi:hypothetical protein
VRPPKRRTGCGRPPVKSKYLIVKNKPTITPVHRKQRLFLLLDKLMELEPKLFDDLGKGPNGGAAIRNAKSRVSTMPMSPVVYLLYV